MGGRGRAHRDREAGEGGEDLVRPKKKPYATGGPNVARLDGKPVRRDTLLLGDTLASAKLNPPPLLWLLVLDRSEKAGDNLADLQTAAVDQARKAIPRRRENRYYRTLEAVVEAHAPENQGG
jgi:hypothetical protein